MDAAKRRSLVTAEIVALLAEWMRNGAPSAQYINSGVAFSSVPVDASPPIRRNVSKLFRWRDCVTFSPSFRMMPLESIVYSSSGTIITLKYEDIYGCVEG